MPVRILPMFLATSHLRAQVLLLTGFVTMAVRLREDQSVRRSYQPVVSSLF